MILNQAIKMSESEAREYLEKLRWPNGPVCPHCKSQNVAKLQNNRCGSRKLREGLYKCRACRKQFTVTVGTIFEGSRIAIKTWLMAFTILCAAKKGISAHQMHRMLGITYKTAWFMCHRIRYAMTQEPLKSLLTGVVEADETYIGGKPRNRAYRGKYQWKGKMPFINKTPVVALVQRNGEVRTKVIANITSKNLAAFMTKNISPNAILNTDQLAAYKPVGKNFLKHDTVNHAEFEFARGEATINHAECFFSLIKRGIMGSFHKVSPEHLPKYCNEFQWRWNFRKIDDGERVEKTLANIEGKRLMYKEPLKKAS